MSSNRSENPAEAILEPLTISHCPMLSGTTSLNSLNDLSFTHELKLIYKILTRSFTLLRRLINELSFTQNYWLQPPQQKLTTYPLLHLAILWNPMMIHDSLYAISHISFRDNSPLLLPLLFVYIPLWTYFHLLNNLTS